MDTDETEFMENLFDALCSALSEAPIRKQFLDSEGPDLMVLMMKFVIQFYRLEVFANVIPTEKRNSPAHVQSKPWITLCRAPTAQQFVLLSLKHSV